MELAITPPGSLTGDNVNTPYLNILPTISLGPASSWLPNFGWSNNSGAYVTGMAAIVNIVNQNTGDYLKTVSGNNVTIWKNRNISIPYTSTNLNNPVNHTATEIYPFTQDTSWVNPNSSNLTQGKTTIWEIKVQFVTIGAGGANYDPNFLAIVECYKSTTLTIKEGCMDPTSPNYTPNANWHNNRMCLGSRTPTPGILT
jgi:hypothetical protein